MKHGTLLILLFISLQASSQVITSVPAFPTESSDITITFDASKGTAGLANFTGDVYAHTGVITTTSTSDTNWRYVVAGWGEFIPKAKLTRSESNPNIYTLVIGNPRTYYNLTDPAEKILKLAMVFRSGAGTSPVKEGKDTGGKDILLPLVEGAVNVKFDAPSRAFAFVGSADSIQFVGLGDAPNLSNLTLSLFKDNSVLTTANNDTLKYTLKDLGTGTHEVKLIGTDGASSDTAFFRYIVRGTPVAEARPEGLEDGITVHQNQDVSFSLFAPGKQSVYLVGDFNNWTPSSDYQMKKHEVRTDSVHFWITVSGLNASSEIGFQYLVDETIRVGDPYSKLVLDPNNDPWIEPATFPDLKKYPTGKTEGIVSVFRINEPEYQWKSTGYQRRPVDQVIAYEMHLRDFVAAHSYKTLTDTLQYLKRLGVNAVKLMPVAEFDGNDSWGYNPAYHMALDKYYGTPESFKVFVDSCHANNIAVILDVVFNHATGSSPLLAMWWNSTSGQAADDNPYAYVSARHPFNVFHDLKHGSTATNFWMKKILKFWLTEYKIDGFRFDLSKGHYIGNTQDVGVWNRYDNWRVNHWKDNYNFIQNVSAEAYVILEHLADDSEEYALANHGMVLWGKMTEPYNEATMGWHENGKSDFRRVHHFQRSSSFQKMGIMSYMESHDEERLMYKNIQFGNSANASHNVKQLPVALKRMQAAGAMFFTIPGPKMIWQFGELGYDVSINANEQGVIGDYRTSRKPIRWQYRNDPDRYKLYRVWGELMKLRYSDPIFSSIGTSIFFNTTGSFKTIRLENGADQVVIVANFGTSTQAGTAGYNKTGTWYDWGSGNAFSVESTAQEAQLEPGVFAIYSTKQYPKPDVDLGVSNEPDEVSTPYSFRLNAAYPNPFNPSTNISFELASASKVQLEVLDLLGRRVALLIDNSQKPAGSYAVSWDAAGLSSGMYLIRMNAGGKQFVQKVTLLK